uniref:Uncharacterized protein n=1 Tax=Opuntia streptacantha TaxID=393608 RepID=A0A7C9DMG2_OPUST
MSRGREKRTGQPGGFGWRRGCWCRARWPATVLAGWWHFWATVGTTAAPWRRPESGVVCRENRDEAEETEQSSQEDGGLATLMCDGGQASAAGWQLVEHRRGLARA